MTDRLERALKILPRTYPGPGGAVAVLRDGVVLARHAWGYANAERRLPFTPHTLFRMCSITKQFTCGLVLDAFADPSVLDAEVAARLPRLTEAPPGLLHLCHNQSGLRDYWAVAMLQGSPVEAPFADREAERLIRANRTLQFRPGTRYSYCNNNFRLLSDILEDRAGEDFATLLRRRLFDSVGMETAFLAADTRAMPDGTEGYEGSQAGGFRAAENRIRWTGDAGLGASLDDMIAWERFIDANRNDPDSLYGRLSAPVRFTDGTPATYGFGLGRRQEFGREVIGHGGALRGWRSHRLHAAADRVSVVVMFNHLSDAQAAALDLLAAVLGVERTLPDAQLPAPAWFGTYLEPETGLSARVEPATPGRVRLRFGHAAETLDLQPDGSAGHASPATPDGTRLRWSGDALWMERPGENQRSRLVPCTGTAAADIAGCYRCSELDATLDIAGIDDALYGAFAGCFGDGRMELLEPLGPDLWALPCWRALDHTPPGDWTLRVRRSNDGSVEGITLGCWLARGLDYARVADAS
ncbi:D-aminopeptidase [Lichenihabitans sp. Uapishka_5]|uniref:D-aminopeptidase n=1 Tax=Lichenihabitans sp. Uapishka_5 TaxID=3037302 RepID=UPI0029E81997|nr:D-aminopeptidase [Lichenihabitans sp. Uapishka_5]MDX7952652.1 D-aminopeptidase [Lichenihabitans sp. Uapishka_5]